MKFIFLLIIICGIFPAISVLIGNGITALMPAIEASMPCIIVVAGIYLIIKSIVK